MLEAVGAEANNQVLKAIALQ
ncbi:hypothetical protein HCN83_13745 [Bacillus luteus]|uniref:Uncharacterized protein n=1 Tax=Alkalicoccus luteus TaxID=1237094 RepID=A0A969PT61_9BACI|nr:hypothetical protein [Alkalicoccus luteus]